MRNGLVALALLAAAPAAAEVVASDDAGFALRYRLTVAAPPARVWAALVAPSAWWNPEHSYSGDAANLTLDPHAGGCWCEKLADGGSVEHMRVLFLQPGRTLRLSGMLGPLQAYPANGVMTVSLAPAASGKGTELGFDYAVAGAPGLGKLAAPVDDVLGEQVARLKAAAER